MSSHVMMYVLRPWVKRSMVSSATRCPGCSALMSFGLRRAFKRFFLSVLPLPLVRRGAVRIPPLSLMIRPMVAGLGHRRQSGAQNSRRSEWSFFSPRFGYRSRRRLISSMMRQSYLLLLLFLGLREPQLRLSSLPFPYRILICQPNSVRRFTLYASSTAGNPYFFQKLIIFARFFATSVIIYANRIACS